MKDYFAILGIERSAAPDEGEIQSRFKEASRFHHPDAGGDPDEFAKLNAARATLLDPVLRLRHWLTLEFGADSAGDIRLNKELAGLFQRTAQILQETSNHLKKHQEAKTSLARSLLIKPMVAIQKDLLALNGEIHLLRNQHIAEISHLDALHRSNPKATRKKASEIAQELGFLGKWQAQIQENLGQIADLRCG